MEFDVYDEGFFKALTNFISDSIPLDLEAIKEEMEELLCARRGQYELYYFGYLCGLEWVLG